MNKVRKKRNIKESVRKRDREKERKKKREREREKERERDVKNVSLNTCTNPQNCGARRVRER